MSPRREAYVSMIFGGDTYLPGLRALGNSLDASGTQRPRIAMVTTDVGPAARQQLRDGGWDPIEVPMIDNPTPGADRLYARYGGVFTKLNLWNLTDYEKLVFIDADALVVNNVDNLFDRPSVSAAPDFFRPDRFNSGVMVVEPSSQTFAALKEGLLKSTSYDGGDQGFLNEFFGDWYVGDAARRLPIGYNVHNFIYQFLNNHPRIREDFLRELRIVHYTLQKPWSTTMCTGGSQLWWRMYWAGQTEREARWRTRLHVLADWSFSRAITAIGG